MENPQRNADIPKDGNPVNENKQEKEIQVPVPVVPIVVPNQPQQPPTEPVANNTLSTNGGSDTGKSSNTNPSVGNSNASSTPILPEEIDMEIIMKKLRYYLEIAKTSIGLEGFAFTKVQQEIDRCFELIKNSNEKLSSKPIHTQPMLNVSAIPFVPTTPAQQQQVIVGTPATFTLPRETSKTSTNTGVARSLFNPQTSGSNGVLALPSGSPQINVNRATESSTFKSYQETSKEDDKINSATLKLLERIPRFASSKMSIAQYCNQIENILLSAGPVIENRITATIVAKLDPQDSVVLTLKRGQFQYDTWQQLRTVLYECFYNTTNQVSDWNQLYNAFSGVFTELHKEIGAWNILFTKFVFATNPSMGDQMNAKIALIARLPWRDQDTYTREQETCRLAEICKNCNSDGDFQKFNDIWFQIVERFRKASESAAQRKSTKATVHATSVQQIISSKRDHHSFSQPKHQNSPQKKLVCERCPHLSNHSTENCRHLKRTASSVPKSSNGSPYKDPKPKGPSKA